MELPQLLYFCCLLLTVVISIVFGGRDERIGAAIVVVASVVTPLAQEHGFRREEIGIFLVDFSALLTLLWLALCSNRYWPLFAAGFQLSGITVHLVPVATSEFSAAAYGLASVSAAYLVLLAIVIGARLEGPIRAR